MKQSHSLFVLHTICTVTPPHTIKPLVNKTKTEKKNYQRNFQCHELCTTIDIIDQ